MEIEGQCYAYVIRNDDRSGMVMYLERSMPPLSDRSCQLHQFGTEILAYEFAFNVEQYVREGIEEASQWA